MTAVNVNYDDLLIGKTNHLDANNFYGTASGGHAEREAAQCIRYVLECILQWEPDEAIQKFDEYMIRALKLDKLLNFIKFPVEVPYGDPKYILSLIYPSKVKIDRKKMTEAIFESVLNAAENENAPLKQFPREYFFGGDGFIRFSTCVAYLIDNYLSFDSIGEIYDFFDSAEGKKFLYRHRLKVPADQYAISMLDVIRYITRNDEDGELMYHFFKFKKLYQQYSKSGS